MKKQSFSASYMEARLARDRKAARKPLEGTIIGRQLIAQLDHTVEDISAALPRPVKYSQKGHQALVYVPRRAFKQDNGIYVSKDVIDLSIDNMARSAKRPGTVCREELRLVESEEQTARSNPLYWLVASVILPPQRTTLNTQRVNVRAEQAETLQWVMPDASRLNHSANLWLGAITTDLRPGYSPKDDVNDALKILDDLIPDKLFVGPVAHIQPTHRVADLSQVAS